MSNNNVNKIILVGNLGRDPELVHTPKGHSVLHFSLATNREFKDSAGVMQKQTSWHRASMWGKRAESCAKHLTKGSRVYVEGELRMQNWTDKDGVQRKSAEIHVDDIKFLGGAMPSVIPTTEEEHAAPALRQ